MEFLPPELEKALDLAKSDPEKAAEVLRFAAKYLKTQGSMPYPLAMFLADAIEKAMAKASMMRGSELLKNLNLQASNRRPKSSFEYVGHDLQVRLDAKTPKGEALIEIGENYGIDPKTVERMYKKFLNYKNFLEEQEEMIAVADEVMNQPLQSNEKSDKGTHK